MPKNPAVSKNSIRLWTVLILVVSCKTSLNNSTIKVVGGKVAKVDMFPAAVFISNCSATRIGKKAVLTAAHCVTDFSDGVMKVNYKKDDSFKIVYGVDTKSGEHIDAKVEKIWVHPKYLNSLDPISATIKNKNQYPDLAIVWVDHLPEVIKIASLEKEKLIENTSLMFTGYGCTKIPEHMRPHGNSDGVAVHSEESSSESKQFFLRWKKVDYFGEYGVMGAIENLDPYGENIDSMPDQFSGCPGDSGSGVYLSEENSKESLKLVGVNSYINPEGSFFTRFDGEIWGELAGVLKLLAQ